MLYAVVGGGLGRQVLDDNLDSLVFGQAVDGLAIVGHPVSVVVDAHHRKGARVRPLSRGWGIAPLSPLPKIPIGGKIRV